MFNSLWPRECRWDVDIEVVTCLPQLYTKPILVLELHFKIIADLVAEGARVVCRRGKFVYSIDHLIYKGPKRGSKLYILPKFAKI